MMSVEEITENAMNKARVSQLSQKVVDLINENKELRDENRRLKELCEKSSHVKRQITGLL